VYRAAEECLTALSDRLAESHYMFGQSPSSLDAVLYAFLGPLLKAPLPSGALQNYLKNCGNLVKFVVRVSQNYFPRVVAAWDAGQAVRPPQSTGGARPAAGGGKEDWPDRRRNQAIAGCVAGGAMLGYAYTSGILEVIRDIEIRVVDDGDEEED
jgi:metaxin